MKSVIPFASRLVSAVLAIVSTFYLTRILGVQLFGTYSAMLSATFFFNLFTDWGFNLYGAQMLAVQTDSLERGKFLMEAISLKALLSAVFSGLYLVMAIFFFENTFFFLLGLPIILFSFLNPEWVCRGVMLPHFVGYRQLIFSVLNVVAFILVYFAKLPRSLTFALYTANTLVSFIIIIFLLTKNKLLYFRPLKFSATNSLILLKRTSLYFYGFLLNNLNYTAGIIILEVFLNSRAAGVYSSYYNIFSNLVTPVIITYSLFAPKMGILPDKTLLIKYYTIIGYIVLAGFFFFLNFRFFYDLFYPRSFNFEPEITIVVALVFIFYCLEYLFVIHSVFINDPKFYFLVNVVGILINISIVFYLLYSHQLSVRNSFLCLLTSQIGMSIFAIVKWPKLVFNFSFKDVSFCLLSLIVISTVHFTLPALYASLISLVLIGAAALRAVSLIKNLY
jgi:PST family polysaccharide transporter